jgi:hypothetical protein
MSRIKYLSCDDDQGVLHEKQYAGIYCPACAEVHFMGVGSHCHGPRWGFNFEEELPAFSPSLLVSRERWHPPVTSENLAEWKLKPWKQEKRRYVCHSFIGCNGAQPGQIIYLSDCTHHLGGKVIDLPEIPDGILL